MAEITTNLGRVMPVFRGAWASGTAYKRLDVVSYEDQSFVATQDLAAGTKPPATGWMLLAGKNPDATNINNAINAAKTATTAANNAASAANTAKANADAATTKANTATTNANNATTSANNAATAATKALAQLGIPVYSLSSGNATLPSGARTPCLIVTTAGELWFEDGKASSDEADGGDSTVPGDSSGTQVGEGE